MRSEPWRIGVDLGGTKIEVLALDRAGNERLRWRLPTPQGDYEATLQTIVRLVEGAEAELGGRASVGLATPGAVSRVTGLLKNSNSVCLNGRPLQADLEHRLDRPLRLDNDANCMALSEAVDGAARGASSVFGAILGTGVGGGVVIGGRVLEGANGIAGEWGHNPLPWPEDDERPGPACYCGRHGCLETFLSGPGLMRLHAAATGEHRDAAWLARAAAEGERTARASLERYADRLARGLAHVINLIDPEAIVLGGGLSNVEWLYEAVPSRWGPYVFSDRVNTRLLRPLHGDSSGVRGAAWLWDGADAAWDGRAAG